MADRDWERELADIDRRLAGIPDAPAPPPATPAPRGRAVPPAAPGQRSPTPAPVPHVPAPQAPQAPRAQRSLGTPAAAPGRRAWRVQLALLLRLAVGAAVVAALIYWPYAAACGAGLAVYLALVGALGLAGVATATSAWRHRAPFVHVLGLAMMVAAAVLGAREVLPRVGYAIPTMERPAAWSCDAVPVAPAPVTAPAITPPFTLPPPSAR